MSYDNEPDRRDIPAPPQSISSGVTKRYGPVTAVDDLTLAIEPGEIVAFLGPNGAGKTTTVDMMLGLSRPNAGSVAVYGRKPADAIARGEVAAVMQTGGLLKDLTVAETVRLTATALPARTTGRRGAGAGRHRRHR